MGSVVAGIAGGVGQAGWWQLATGQRPDLPDLLLTPSSVLRLTEGLSHMRGAALKLGQMLSMDTGPVLGNDRELKACPRSFEFTCAPRTRLQEQSLSREAE